MNTFRKLKLLMWFVSFWVGFYPVNGIAEDIDIFVGSSAGASANPNVLIVLDNTANWSRMSQKWPESEQQGQSEVSAISTVIQTLDDKTNVGLMEFVTGGSANDNGGFIRYAIRPMDGTNKTNFTNTLTTIYNNVTSPDEKRSSGTPYGNLMYDVYNYYKGANQSQSGSGTLGALADSGGYTSNYGTFKSPLSCDTNCAKTFVILVSNPAASGPSSDDSANTTALSSVGGNTAQLGLPNFTTSSSIQTTLLGNSGQCYADQSACNTAVATTGNSDYTSFACANYSGGCSCGSAVSGATSNCSAGQQAYTVTGTINGSATTTYGAWTNQTCIPSASCVAPANTSTNNYQCAQSTCAAGLERVQSQTITTAWGNWVTIATYGNAPTCTANKPANTATTNYQCAGTGNKTLQSQPLTTTTGGWGDTASCVASSAPLPADTATTGYQWTTTGCSSGKQLQARTITPASGTPTTTNLGMSTACYASAAACTAAYACPAQYTGGCACASPTSGTYPTCASGNVFQINENDNVITNTPTGTYTTDTNPFNADEWARFLYQKGIPLSGCSNQTVTTYTIDVYNAQPSATHTALMLSAAKAGGGKYFNASNKSALVNALKQIFLEIQSVNSTFASASLPINATNRAQNENQVFIGMFRPDPDAKPRWFGNVKRYQLIQDSGGDIQLGDVNGTQAINSNTGFISDCATSWWTTDSPNPPGKTDSSGYWSAYPINPTPAGKCTTTTNSAYSDSPDGPRVEKGAIAEVVRKGNNPPTTDGSPSWSENRTVYTANGTTLQTFNTSNTGLSDTLVKWARGQDTEDENSNGALGSQSPAAIATETRASLHGDVVHSRPLPVNYGGSGGVTVYYGANDGTLRAVDAGTGKEKWAFIAPEFNANLDRLRTQSPLVAYPNISTSISPTPTKRDYFLDGSIGLYQTASNDKVWIFPTMRRGGRMIYALDVTNSSAPSIKWKFGCPNLANDTGCTAGAADIGQTWSIPNVAFIKSYSTSVPVAVVGGGYDSCEDANTSSPSCDSAKGRAVYVLNTDSGAVVASFPTLRGVVADVALIDMDLDGSPDYAYVGDTGGNLYRINFSTYDSTTGTYTKLSPGAWTMTRIAYTSAGGRKFLFTPALFGGSGKIYIALGSGDREHPLQTDYPYSGAVTNRFYMYRDCLPTPSPASSSLAGGDNLDDTSLMNGTSATSPAGCDDPKTLTNNCATNKGWFINLNNGTGEQTVTSAIIAGGMVAFSTNRTIPAAAGTCGTALGEARGYWLDLFNGSGAIGVVGSCGGAASSTFVGGGLPPSPVIGTVLIDGVPTSVVIGAVKKDGGASSPISPQKTMATNLPARKRVYSIMKGEN